MGTYSAVAEVTAGADTTIMNITGGTAARVKVKYISVTSSSAPADTQTKLQLLRSTSVGTSDNDYTPVNLDPGDPKSADATVKTGDFSGEPTATIVLHEFALNQRGSYQFHAPEKAEFVSTVAANNGISLKCVSSSGTPEINATIVWEE
ncbi:hypothetical protein Pan216_20830 [Planctomycetes bacterium Pan216]|uniref:Uncharacterized protein n=1 Tax=Kolteria novifilia TaxID=2527975 RepID=A0A518B2L3_9BACT|nr:hypothetical protein Pan216_20830 [Planctomycetes bacterium Pan216]